MLGKLRNPRPTSGLTFRLALLVLGSFMAGGVGADGADYQRNAVQEKPEEAPRLKYTSRLNFFFTHACGTAVNPNLRTASETIEIQLFEALDGKRTGEKWPDAAGEVYFLDGHSMFKNTRSISIRCAPSTLVCFGATLNGRRSSHWGLGGDGESSCTDCCASCPPGGWRDFRTELRC